MTLRHIRIFLSVFQNNGITKAAQELHIAQPSVSLAVKEMEEYYGTKLFDRIGKKIYPTQNGRRLYDYALKICGLFDEANRSVKNPDTLGEIRIGASITTGTKLLPDILKRYKTIRPEITVTAVVGNSDEIEKKVLANEIDVGFTEKDHIRLRDALLEITGKFLVSYNDCPEIRKLWDKPGIYIEEISRLNNMAQRYESGSRYAELLISNYDTKESVGKPCQLSFFDETGG